MAIVYRHRRTDNNSIFYIGVGAADTMGISPENLIYRMNTKNNYPIIEL